MQASLSPRQMSAARTIRVWRGAAVPCGVMLVALAAVALAADDADESTEPPAAAEKQTAPNKSSSVAVVPDPKQTGGEPDGIVQVANLVYAGTKSSECFSDHFLVKTEKETSISTSRRFHAVKLSSDEIYNFPLLIMTGEGSFTLPDSERRNLRKFVEQGGFLLASAGCSSAEWNKSFRNELARIFPDIPLAPLPSDHPVFHTVYDLDRAEMKHGSMKPLEGIILGGRLAIIYSQDGLNDTQHTQGCCCCGGNEIRNAQEFNVNILAYSLSY